MDLAVVGLTSLGQVSGTGVVKEITVAYAAKNHSAFESAAARMMALIEGMDAIASTQEDLLLGRHLRQVRQWGQNGTTISPQPTCEDISATITQANFRQHQCVSTDSIPVDPAWAKCEIDGCCYSFVAALNKSVCLKRKQTLAQGYVRTAVQLLGAARNHDGLQALLRHTVRVTRAFSARVANGLLYPAHETRRQESSRSVQGNGGLA